MNITFKFNNEVATEKGGQESSVLGGSSKDRYIASQKIAELWITFARARKPAGSEVPEWSAYDPATRATMRIDTNCEVIFDRFKHELDVWRSIGRL